MGSGPPPAPEDFLGRLAEPVRSALVAAGRTRRFDRGEVVLTEGGESRDVVVLLEGRVKVTTASSDGREVMFGARGPGAVLGELSAVDGHPHSATITALEPVEALLVPTARFRVFLAEHGDAALVLLLSVIARLRDADRKRLEFGGSDALGRVAARLVEMAHDHGHRSEDGVVITLPLSQEELAGWTGLSREAVAKALRVLRERGLVETRRRSVVVVDPLRLARDAWR